MTTFQLNRDKPLHNQVNRSSLEKIGQHWFKIVLALFALHIIFNKDVNIQVNFSDKNEKVIADFSKVEKLPASFSSSAVEVKPALTTNKDKATVNLGAIAGSSKRKVNTKISEKRVAVNHNLRGAQFNNLAFILNRGYAKENGVSHRIVDKKMENCRQYVERFARVAITEQERFDIPASITLAQAILATDAGDNQIVKESKNHFGLKSNKELDMLHFFASDWASYREHSNLLSTKRYVHLKKLSRKDYKGWARGLQKAGYTTDKNYAKKIIRIIETLDLYQFDA